MKNFAFWFGGALAYLLLFLYAGCVGYLCTEVVKHPRKESTGKDKVRLERADDREKGDATAPKPSGDSDVVDHPRINYVPVREGFAHVLTSVGGLVSALVIATLAITKPGEAPGDARWAAVAKVAPPFINFLVIAYLIGWALTGLSAMLVGVLIYPEVSPTLADIGMTWLGLAVAAVYSYFGIRPPA